MECCDAAATGNLDLLKQLRDNGRPWDKWTCASAARNGQLNVLQWASKNGCPWDEDTCAYAALRGRLETLQWARKNGCPWNEKTCVNAVGHHETLRWVIANGCDHKHIQIDKQACVERGVFPGYGCLVAGCSDITESEGLCTIHKAAVYRVLAILMCDDTAKLVVEIVCALN